MRSQLKSCLPLLVITSLLSAACSAHKRAASTDPNVITLEQIQERHFTNAYDVVAALRPNWLHARGTDSFQAPGQVLVYYDNMRMGGVESLRTITTPTIIEIRHFDGIAATTRWGLDHGQGVIQVSSHR